MGVSSDIEVFVPPASRVSIEGFSATITVAGVTGTVSAETVNGSITQNGAAKEVQLQSVNGAVETTEPDRPRPGRGRERPGHGARRLGRRSRPRR